MARVIYQFRISLAEVQPPVWRRFQVPADYSLARLPKVIQALMDWQDYLLHEFTVNGRAYGDPEVDEEDRVADDRHVRLRDLGFAVGDRVEYIYDFGDNWQHTLELRCGSTRCGSGLPAVQGAVNSAPRRRMLAGYRDMRNFSRCFQILPTRSTRI
jgi:hypothetical protein